MPAVEDPRVDRLLALLERYRAELRTAFDSAPEQRRDARPADDTWSVANVIEHLAATERAVAGLVSQFLTGAGSRPDDDVFDPALFEQDVNMAFFLDRSQRFRGSQPTGQLNAVQAWEALESSRGDLLAILEQSRGRQLEGFTRSHPTGRSLNAYQWVAFVALHEGRHAAQVRAMVASEKT